MFDHCSSLWTVNFSVSFRAFAIETRGDEIACVDIFVLTKQQTTRVLFVCVLVKFSTRILSLWWLVHLVENGTLYR